ncbi:MAG TPA: hypothetical protein VJ991_03195 [Balneolales bacterium]|nr:hypothetical protein [Balneolales bacterium]
MEVRLKQKNERDFIDITKRISVEKSAWTKSAREILKPELLEILTNLHHELEVDRQKLLTARKIQQEKFDKGDLPDYLPRDTAAVTGDWKVDPLPDDIMTRRVEITGPVNNTKMVINMLSRNDDGIKADMAMLDFEDSMKPTWVNVIDGVHNVIGAAKGDLRFIKPGIGDESEKIYEIDPNDMAGVMVRCRGLHLNESHVLIDGKEIAGGLFDIAVTFYHTARELLRRGKTPMYYVPKCEHYLEARWWNRLFTSVENALELPNGTLKATFLIETLPASYQMEEILYEFREHAAGLNGGRWDKIFSDIKVLKNHADRVLADRGTIDMLRPWMDNYVKRIIKICHARGAFAMGGMSAFTPGSTAQIREEQTAKVLEDKKHEFDIGHDGCWVSHPYFITYAMKAFSRENQLDRQLDDFDKYPDLLPKSTGPITIGGMRKNIRVGIGYMNGWNQDIGCVAWDNLMEDLATLEISRAQIWQWLHHKVELNDGHKVTRELVHKIFDEELEKILSEVKSTMKDQPEASVKHVIDGFKKAREDAESIFTQEELASSLHEALAVKEQAEKG